MRLSIVASQAEYVSRDLSLLRLGEGMLGDQGEEELHEGRHGAIVSRSVTPSSAHAVLQRMRTTFPATDAPYRRIVTDAMQ